MSEYDTVCRRLKTFGCLGLWLLTVGVGHSATASYGPLQTRSQNPLYLQWLALPMEAPPTLRRGQIETIAHTTFSNLFDLSTTGNTLLDTDMELWRTAFVLGYGFGHHVDIRVELPFITTSGGFLDGFVQNFHHTFGFPNGGRERVADYRFSYRMSHSGVSLFNHDSQTFSLSDVILRGKFFVPQSITLPIDLAVLPYIKFPTGQQSEGLSSGHLDGGLAVLAQKSWGDLSLTTQVGGVILGGHEDLDDFLRAGFFSFGLSIEYRIVRWLAVIGQLTGNTSAFQNLENTPLSEIVLDLNIGVAGVFPLGRDHKTELFYQVSFTEDVLSKGPSVDFSVFLLAGLRFPASALLYAGGG